MVDIRAAYDGAAIRWVVADQGSGFDHAAALRRLDESPPDLMRPSGRGLIMMKAFVDELSYEDGGRRVSLMMRRQASEARTEPRHPTQRPVTVTPVAGDGRADPAGTHEALTRNISHGGICLLQSHLATHGRVLITIPGASGEPIQVPAEVRHWHALSESVVEVGCRFEAPGAAPDEPPTPELAGLHGMVGRIAEAQKPLAERRVAQRLPYTECIGVLLEGGREVRGFGRDLSRTGIAFFTDEEVPLGPVRLTLPQSQGEPICVRAQVVRCTHVAAAFHDVAARFLG
jgi:hypothetical protein